MKLLTFLAGHGFVPTQRNDTYALIDPLKSNFNGQNVLITGAARGLGEEMAIPYAKAGASGIALLDILDAAPVEPELLVAAKVAGRCEPKLVSVKVDVTDEHSVVEAVKAVWTKIRQLGFCDQQRRHYDRLRYAPRIRTCQMVARLGGQRQRTYLISRAFLPLVLKGKQKTFVVLSSAGAHFTLPKGSSYESSKLAVLKLNNYLMAEHGSDRVLAYAIAPGGVATAMAAGFPIQYHDRLSDTPQMVADTLVFLTKERRDWLATRYAESRWDTEEFLAKKDAIIQKDLLKVRMAM